MKMTRFENAVQVLMDKSRQGVVDSKNDEDVIKCARRLMEIVEDELPHWLKANEEMVLGKHLRLVNGKLLVSCHVPKGEYYLDKTQLERLPKQA